MLMLGGVGLAAECQHQHLLFFGIAISCKHENENDFFVLVLLGLSVVMQLASFKSGR